MIFEFGSWGHIPNYLRLIFEYWRDHGVGRLHAVVGEQLVKYHPAVFEGLDRPATGRITWTAISAEEEEIVRRYQLVQPPSGKTAANDAGKNKYMFMWSLIRKHTGALKPRHVLFLTLDELLLPLCGGLQLGVNFSGIMFRPLFQYADAWAAAVPTLAHVKSLPQRLFVKRLFNHPELRVAFFIDETIPKTISTIISCEAVHLPDPVRLPARQPQSNEITALRRKLDIPDSRTALLFFGDISKRKGLWNLLDAIALLGRNECEKICLAIVGKTGPLTEQKLAARTAELQLSRGVTILRQPDYVTDTEMREWFFASDVVLAPYRHHVGMSGIQLLAAAHQRPLLSQDFGLMGDLTKANKLGRTCDPDDIPVLADSIRLFLGDKKNDGWDPARALQFAKRHSYKLFAKTLFRNLERFIAPPRS